MFVCLLIINIDEQKVNIVTLYQLAHTKRGLPKEASFLCILICKDDSTSSEAIGLNIVSLICGVVHSGNCEGFELHNLNVLRSITVDFNNALGFSLTENVKCQQDGLLINGVEKTVEAAIAAVLNEVLSFMTKSVKVLSGPVGLSVVGE